VKLALQVLIIWPWLGASDIAVDAYSQTHYNNESNEKSRYVESLENAGQTRKYLQHGLINIP
jgi:hypothetical protein